MPIVKISALPSQNSLAGIKRAVWSHLLRHTKLTQLGESGFNPFSLQKFAGHSNIQTTMGYIHASESVMAAEVLAKPMLVIEDVPKKTAALDVDSMRVSLTMRLAKGEISEATFNRAMTMFEPNPLERLR